MATVNITINGRALAVRAGSTVLDAAKEVGIDIPRLCHHPALGNIGACRVLPGREVAKQRTLQPACTFPVTEGMEVQTESPKAVEARKFVLEMLFSERNHYCMFCEMSGDCELQALAYRYGLDHWTYPTPNDRMPVDGTRQYFVMDHNRCILCRRCIRACSEIAASHTLGLRYRGAKSMICADMDVPFGESSCVSCGTCLSVCPTGALIDRKSAYIGREKDVQHTKTTCVQCGVGCGMDVVTRTGKVLRIESAWDAPVNKGLLCVAGRFDPLYDTRDRVTHPMVRKGGKLTPVSWDEALSLVATNLKAARGTAAGLTTASASNEALAAFQQALHKTGTSKIGTPEPKLPKLGFATQGRLSDLDGADCILVVGVDPLADHRVVGYHIKRALDNGARLEVVSDGGNSLAAFAHRSVWMRQLSEAVKVCEGATKPVVIYGPALDPDDASKLAPLATKAAFIGLAPGSNRRGAAALGLDGALVDGAPAILVHAGESCQNDPVMQRAVSSAGFSAVVASYLGPLTEKANVVLPTVIWSEAAGTTTNVDGDKQAVTQVVAPPDGVWQADKILGALAKRM